MMLKKIEDKSVLSIEIEAVLYSLKGTARWKIIVWWIHATAAAVAVGKLQVIKALGRLRLSWFAQLRLASEICTQAIEVVVGSEEAQKGKRRVERRGTRGTKWKIG